MTPSEQPAPVSENLQLLARALRGDKLEPGAMNGVVDAALYHGVAGLLIEKPQALRGWPEAVVAPLRDQARAQAMWELRHRSVLAGLLEDLARSGIKPILMKGTAVAYDLYDNPATRSRGDTDLLIDAAERQRARSVLDRLGFRLDPIGAEISEDLARQEGWSLADGDSQHSIDLHWQVLNAPALHNVLTFAECAAHARPLPRLAPEAWAMDRARTLIHTCVHRAMHLTAPYFVGGHAHFGSDRLIWTSDIHLLAGALTDDDWSSFGRLAVEKGVAQACLEGLQAAQRDLATAIPGGVLDALGRSGVKTSASAYLSHRRALPRAWLDLLAVAGLGPRIRYVRQRLQPGARFLRAKYPGMARMPIPILYARRIASLFRIRTPRRP